MLSGKVWPIHPSPAEDELLSSWLTRIARLNYTKLHTLVSIAFPNTAIWNRDIDRSASSVFLRQLAARSGKDLHQVRQTTLNTFAYSLGSSIRGRGNDRWIMSAGIYHRTRKQPWLGYCPLCLAEDLDPYFRRRWRLAFYTVCHRHSVLLLDRCSQCQSVIQFFRHDLGDRNKPAPLTLNLCFHCQFDLSRAPAYGDAWSDWRVQQDMSVLGGLFDLGYLSNFTGEFQYNYLYLDVLHQLARCLASRLGQPLWQISRQMAHLPAHNIPAQFRYIEQMDITTRHELVTTAIWLLHEWPSRLLHACTQTHIKSSTLFRDWPQAPYWFASAIFPKLYSPNQHISLEEISEAIAYCHRHYIPVNTVQVAKVLGLNSSKRIRGFLRHLNL